MNGLAPQSIHATRPRELALFAGVGGGILGGKLLNWRTVCAVEINEYCRRVLMQRQDDRILDHFPIWDDITTFDGRPWRGCVDIISGGFPCQNISAAGDGTGIDGVKSGLWLHMARVIGEVGPESVLVENSPLLTKRGLGRVLGDLAEMGYDARWGVLGAHHAGAPHKRDRIWIVAHSDSVRQLQPQGSQQDERRRVGDSGENVAHSKPKGLEGHRSDSRQPQITQPRNDGPSLADADEQRLQTSGQGGGDGISAGEPQDHSATAQVSGDGAPRDWWSSEPDVGRVADGIPSRVDRLKALGNAQVPRVAALAYRLLSPR